MIGIRKWPAREGTEPQTVDYRRTFWGHAYRIYARHDDGRRLSMSGHGPSVGPRLEVGDFALFRADDGGTVRFRFTEVGYHRNPDDMWFGELTFVSHEGPAT